MINFVLTLLGGLSSFETIVSNLTKIETRLKAFADKHDNHAVNKKLEATKLLDEADAHAIEKARALEAAKRIGALVA